MIVKTREQRNITQIVDAESNKRLGSVRTVDEDLYLVTIYGTRHRFEIAGDRDYAIAVLADRVGRGTV